MEEAGNGLGEGGLQREEMRLENKVQRWRDEIGVEGGRWRKGVRQRRRKDHEKERTV